MELDYRKTFEIEIINEFQSAIHSKILNFVLNNEFDKSDSKNLQTNLLNQLSNMNQINLFKLSLEELETYHEYLRAIKKYADSITWKIIPQFYISGQHQIEKVTEDKKGSLLRSERSLTNVRRQYLLEKVKEDEIKASYSDGILKLILPKDSNKETKKSIPID